MPGGRPAKDGGPERYPELGELAEWFRQAMADAGYESPNAVVRAELAQRNVVYGIHNGTRLLKREILRALAIGLGRDPAEVEPLWIRAKEAMDRAAAARQEEATRRLVSWAQLPLPALAARNLVEAQSRAVERLPYDVLGVEEPPLSAVYVRQHIRMPVHDEDGSSRAASRAGGESGESPAGFDRGEAGDVRESVLPVPDALARHEHLLITGEPGAGKSTLSSHLAWTVSRIWLREDSSLESPLTEPVIPVRVSARSLIGEGGSWSSVLCAAVRASLGRSLVCDPPSGLFGGRVQGARWLVMVDGLDEIADRQARTGVIRTIAQHARTGSDYRFVVTTRPLPDTELAPLRGSLTGSYVMEPFGDAELRDFAGKWFAAQHSGDKERARSAADRFLKETEDGRLHELVQNPLLATIAAVNATVDPAKPLPTSRLSLYQGFCENLLSRGVSTGSSRTRLRRRYQDDPERRDFHVWLDARKAALLGALGRRRVEAEGSLMEAARVWVGEHGEGDLLGGWEAELREFLSGTGMVVPDGDDFRFLHHSFAEFMAARSYAEEIPEDFPEMETWVRRAFQGDERTFALFVFCLWSERAECEADRIALQLLDGSAGGHQRKLLAGVLMAEGARFSEENHERVLDHLEAIGLHALDPDDRDAAFEALGALGQHPGVLVRLERIAARETLSEMTRLRAVEAFSRAGAREDAERLLLEVMDAMWGALPRATRVACGVSDTAREAARRRAHALVRGPAVDAFELSVAAEALECLGDPEQTEAYAARAIEHPGARRDHLKRAAEAWLKARPATAPYAIERCAAGRPPTDQVGRATIAEALDAVGETEPAGRIARTVLRSGVGYRDVLDTAARIWLKAQGEEGRSEIVAAIGASDAQLGHGLWVPGVLMEALAKAGLEPDGLEWAPDVVGDHRWGVCGGGDVIAAWLAAEGSAAVPAVMERTQRGRALAHVDRLDVANALLDAGARAEAGEVAELTLRTPLLRADSYEEAAGVLLKVEDDGVGERLERVWRTTPLLAADSRWLRGMIDALKQGGEESLSRLRCRFARELVALGQAQGDDVFHALRVLADSEGHEAVPELVRHLEQHPKLTWHRRRDLAQQLASMRADAAARDAWRHLLRRPSAPERWELSLLLDVQAAGAVDDAREWLQELIADPETFGARRLRLRQLLAWLEAGEASEAQKTGSAAEGADQVPV
ncbi:hypothetical protein [Streptomyces sp. ODS28]|uniref:hypothetical protein n=1 Tax=Streptomyces sp. ODS28 TaxID=3136688 RepID=UPI0031E97C93